MSIVAHEMDWPEDLSVEELKALKKRWWSEAQQDGSIEAIGRVVRELGTCHPKKHGANWIWSEGSVEIVLDDWTGHTYVTDGKAQVFARTYTSEVFVPAPWVDVVLRADVVARAKRERAKLERDEAERQELLRQLGAARGCQVCGEPHGVSVPCGFRREAP